MNFCKWDHVPLGKTKLFNQNAIALYLIVEEKPVSWEVRTQEIRNPEYFFW